MKDRAARIQAGLDKLNAEIETMADDEPGLKEGDWITTPKGLGLIETFSRDGKTVKAYIAGESNYFYPRCDCTRIPFDVNKLAESMMALPVPDGCEWTGEVRRPREGEYVLDAAESKMLVLNADNFLYARPILRKIN